MGKLGGIPVSLALASEKFRGQGGTIYHMTALAVPVTYFAETENLCLLSTKWTAGRLRRHRRRSEGAYGSRLVVGCLSGTKGRIWSIQDLGQARIPPVSLTVL